MYFDKVSNTSCVSLSVPRQLQRNYGNKVRQGHACMLHHIATCRAELPCRAALRTLADIVNFTVLSATHPTPDIVLMLDEMFSAFDSLCDDEGVSKASAGGLLGVAACDS